MTTAQQTPTATHLILAALKGDADGPAQTFTSEQLQAATGLSRPRVETTLHILAERGAVIITPDAGDVRCRYRLATQMPSPCASGATAICLAAALVVMGLSLWYGLVSTDNSPCARLYQPEAAVPFDCQPE